MSELAIFTFGSVVFLITAWASVAFGVQRMHELQEEDLDAAGRIVDEQPAGLTEIHRRAPLPNRGASR